MANYTETVTYDLRVADNGVGVWINEKRVGAWRPEDGLSGFVYDADGDISSSYRLDNPALARHCALCWAKHVLDRDSDEPSDAAEKAEPEPPPAPETTPRRIVAMCGSPESALIAFDDGTIWLRTDNEEEGERWYHASAGTPRTHESEKRS